MESTASNTSSNSTSDTEHITAATRLRLIEAERHDLVEYALQDDSEITTRWMFRKTPTIMKAIQDEFIRPDLFFEANLDLFGELAPNFDVNMPGNSRSAVEKEADQITGKALLTRFFMNAGLAEDIYVHEATLFSRYLVNRIVALVAEMEMEMEMEEQSSPSTITHTEWMHVYKMATDVTCQALAPKYNKRQKVSCLWQVRTILC
jgi:hypothetical protein